MAPQDSPDFFTALPTELLQEILFKMSSPEDLYAAIRASKRLSHAFSGLREQILITVIESSLDPGIFIEILGLLHVPDYKGLNHVAEGPRPELPGEETYLAWLTDWHEFCRRVEQLRLLKEFRYNHVNRIDIASSSGDIQPFPIPRARRTDDAEQRAHFKREVNDVAEIYGKLRSHMKHWHIYMKQRKTEHPPESNESVRLEWAFALPPPEPSRTDIVAEQRHFLRSNLLERKLNYSYFLRMLERMIERIIL